jgi:cyclopropane fatty-acyl-phospholipid synthase-like methyltransferase
VSDPQDFEASYAGSPPWDIGRPQSAFVRLAEAGELRGRVLDVGCGTGEHALLAAGLGLDATGIDLAPTAIRLAKQKTQERGIEARFLEFDALDLSALGEHYDTVLDCGLFHVFDDADRRRFVESLSAVTVEGGRYHMLCFSDRVPGDRGPRRVTEAELRASFAIGWRVDSIERSVLEITLSPEGAQAWLATFTRL